jgi:predicted DNA repair protein MutK
MPAASLLALLDDIASVLDDVATMTKVATKKTAGVLLMTVGVYGFVAGVVKLDDLGLSLSRLEGDGAAARRALGRGILRAAPWLMKALSVAGTAAMFPVGGGIVVLGVPALHHAAVALAAAVPGAAMAWLAAVLPMRLDALVGVGVGAVVLLVVAGVQRVRRTPAASG